MTLTEVKDFLTSLSPDKGQAEEMHGWRFDDKLQPFDHTMFYDSNGEGYSGKAIEYLVERIRRSESREVPDLKEKVKAAILEAMRSAEAHENFMCMADETDVYAGDYGAWCDLCAPEEVKP